MEMTGDQNRDPRFTRQATKVKSVMDSRLTETISLYQKKN